MACHGCIVILKLHVSAIIVGQRVLLERGFFSSLHNGNVLSVQWQIKRVFSLGK